jgi:hypothetical protein
VIIVVLAVAACAFAGLGLIITTSIPIFEAEPGGRRLEAGVLSRIEQAPGFSLQYPGTTFSANESRDLCQDDEENYSYDWPATWREYRVANSVDEADVHAFYRAGLTQAGWTEVDNGTWTSYARPVVGRPVSLTVSVGDPSSKGPRFVTVSAEVRCDPKARES